jgi:hypothetical protein
MGHTRGDSMKIKTSPITDVHLRLLAMLTIMMVSCASTGSKFGKLYPGMTSDQVVQTMEKGPSKVEQFPEGYASWYYGENHCLLMKEEKIITKSQTEEKEVIGIPELGGMKEKKKAECIPPYMKSAKKVEREVETPFGTIRR